MLGREPLPARDCESPPHMLRWKQKRAQRVGKRSRCAAGSRGSCSPALATAPGLGSLAQGAGDRLALSCPAPAHSLPPCRPASWVCTGPLWTTMQLPWKQPRSAVRPTLSLQKSLRYA